jgi:iron complex outermembrane receptor protein
MRRTFVSLCVLHAVSRWPLPSLNRSATPQIELQALSITSTPTANADGPVEGYKATRSASATRTDTALHETPQSVSVVPKDVLEDTGATRLQDGLDYAGGVGRANNFGGQGLTTFTVRGFTTGEFYRNGFPINRGYPNARRQHRRAPGSDPRPGHQPVRPWRPRRHLQRGQQAAAARPRSPWAASSTTRACTAPP